MRNFVIILAFLFSLAVLTKPADQDIINQCITHEAGNSSIADSLLRITGIGQHAYRIEDHIFCKQVYNRITGTRVGTALFGTVIFDK